MSECSVWEVNCKIGETVAEFADDIIAKWAQSIADGVNKSMLTLGTIWVKIDANVGGNESVVAFIQDRTKWLVVMLATGSLIVAGMQMAWNQRGEPLRDVLTGMMRLIIVAGAFPAIAQILIDMGDIFSPWVIEAAAGDDDGKFLAKILDMNVFTAPNLGPIILIVGGLIALLSNIVQIFLMFVRSGLLTILTGFSPMAAASSTTRWGQQWFNKYVGWTMAFIAYKPTAAIIYASAIKLISGDSYSFSDEIGSFFMGIIFLILAIMALPALVTFLVPVAGNIGSGGGAAVVGGALATGASSLARHALSKGRGSRRGAKSSSSSGQSQATSTPTGASSVGSQGAGAVSAGASTGAASTGAASTGAASTGAASTGAGAGAGGAAASGGAAAGAAGGPVGVAVVAGAKAVGAGVGAVKSAAVQSMGQGSSGASPVAAPGAAGPSGASGARGSRGASGERGSSSSSDAGGSRSTGAREVHRR